MTTGKLAEVIATFGEAYSKLYPYRPEQQQVVTNILQCRTGVLGGTRLQCRECDKASVQYCSCRNRHCSQCQSHASEEWKDQRLESLLPVPYFHLVFTLPHSLNGWARLHPRVLYKLLFQSVWGTLNTFGEDPKRLGGQLGATMVLHTWGQKLDQHIHMHCLIPGGAWSKDENAWHAATSSTYLFPVKALSRLYRGKMVSLLRQARLGGELDKISSDAEVNKTLSEMMKIDWVVYTKACHGKPERVVDYLSRYTYRIAISESRIKEISDEGVHFRWKDYRTNQQKTMLLSGVEFLRRFLQHVLPKGFMRIRHYGFLANCHRRRKLKEIKVALGLEEKGNNECASEGSRGGAVETKPKNPTWYCCHCRSQDVKVVERLKRLRPRPIQKAA